MVDNGKFVKDENEHVDPPFIILNGEIGPLEFLYVILPLTPHQIGIGQEIILISSTSHIVMTFFILHIKIL